MGAIEIILILLGIVVFIVSFLLPAGKTDSAAGAATVSEEDIHNMLEKEVTGVRSQISEIADETITYSMEKTERSMERLTNEKMMAINEYSDTVLSEINKNHKEVVFLYDMLNDKHDNLLSTVSEASKTASEIKQAVCDVEVSAKEAQEKVRAVQESVSEVMSFAKEVAAERQAAMVNSVYMAEAAQGTGSLGAAPAGMQNMAGSGTAAQGMNGAAAGMQNAAGAAALSGEDEGEISDFRPIMPERVEIIGNAPDGYGDSTDGEDAFLSDGSGAASDRLDKKVRRQTRIRKEAKEETRAAGAASGRLQVSPAEVPEIAVAMHTEQGSRNNNERILELHRAGKSNMAIAKELGLGIGEVKLVIDLFEGI